MDLENIKLIKICNLYISRKNKERAIKKRQEYINSIVKGLLTDRTSSQAISAMREVTELFNSKLDDRLKEGLESIEAISTYKKLKRK